MPFPILRARSAAAHPLSGSIAAACLALAFAGSARAAADTWLGNTDEDWATAANWLAGTSPVSGDSFIFGPAGAPPAGTPTTLVNSLTSAAFNVAGITFNSGAGAFTMGGNAFTLTGDVANNASVLEIINEAVALSGVRTCTTTAGGGNLTLGGILSGTGGLTVAGTGTLTLSVQNTYTGNTIVNGGILDLTGGGGSIGVIRGTATVNAGGTLRLSTGDAVGYSGVNTLNTINLVGGALVVNTTANQTLGDAVINLTGGSMSGIAGSNLDFFNPGNGNSSLNSLASATTSTISGLSLDIRQAAGVTFTVASGTTPSGIDLDISSVITNATNGANPFTKAGAGTLRFTGNNNYTGATTVSAGLLDLDYTINNTSKISATNALSLAGGATVEFVGNAAAATSQNVKGLTLTGNGLATITLATAAGEPLTADFTANSGVLTRTGAALNVVTTGTGTAQLKLAGTVANTAMLPWATYNSTVFAGTDTNDFVRAASTVNATATDLSTWTSGFTQYATTGNAFINSVGPGVVIDGVTFSDTAARTVAIGAGNTLSINQGIIVTPAVGANASVITGGTIAPSAAGGSLNFLQDNPASSLTITSTLGNNGGSTLDKEGAGAVILNVDANAYTGGTTINSGELQALATTTAGLKTTFGTGPITVNSGATLHLKTGSTGNLISYANNLALNSATLNSEDGVTSLSGNVTLSGSDTINVVFGGKTLALNGALTGSGTLALTGAGALILGGTSTGYTGAITVTTDTLAIASTGNVSNLGAVTINNNGAVLSDAGTISCGAITLGASNNTNGAAITVASGGSLTSPSLSSNWGTAVTVNGTYSAGTVSFTPNAATAVSGAGLFSTSTFSVGNGTTAINFTMTGALNVTGLFSLGASGTPSFNQSAGTVNLNSATANDLRIGSATAGTYNLSGTTSILNGLNTDAVIGFNAAGTLAISGGTANLLGVKFGSGASTAAGTLTLTGGTLNVGADGIFKGTSGANTININLGAGTVGSVAGSGGWLSALGVTLTDAANGVTFDTTNGGIGLTGSIGGAGALKKTGPGQIALSGAVSYSGTTTVNAGTLYVSGPGASAGATTINGGMLTLDYSTANTAKLALGALLNLNGGTLNLTGGSAAEAVGGTVLNGTAFLTRSAGSSNIGLGALSGFGALDIGLAGLATTTTPNTNGILGPAITLGGTALAANDGSGNIVAYTGYSDFNRLGGSVAGVSSAANIRIIDGGSSGNVTLPAASGTTEANTVFAAATGGATVFDLGSGNTLLLGTAGGVVQSSAVTGGLTIQNGTLTAGGTPDTAGLLTLNNLSAANAITISSVIADNGAGSVFVNDVGLGIVALTGINTYSGTTTVAGGILQIAADGNLGAVPAAATPGSLVLNGGTLAITTGLTINPNRGLSLGAAGGVISLPSGNQTTTYSGIIAGAGSGVLTIAGSGDFVLGGVDTYTGGTVINAARVQTNVGAAFGTGLVTVNGSGATGGQFYATGGTFANNFVISGYGGGGAGPVQRGALRLDGATLSGAITLAASAGIDVHTGTGTINGNISGPFVLTVGNAASDTGTLVLSGKNSFAGLTISAGTLQAKQAAEPAAGTYQGLELGSGPVTLASGATLYFFATNANTTTSRFNYGNSFTINGGTIIAQDGDVHLVGLTNFAGNTTLKREWGLLSATGAATKALVLDGVVSGTSTLTLQTLNTAAGGETGVTVFTNNANTFNGTIVVDNTTNTAAGTAVDIGGATSLQNATLNLNGNGTGLTANRSIIFSSGITAPVIGSLTGAGNVILQTTDGATVPVKLSLGNNGTSNIYSGVLSGPGGVIKVGAGTETFSGINTYTGATMVNAGTLIVSGGISGSAASISGGSLGGTGAIGSVTVNAGGTISPGLVGTIGTLNTGALTFNGGGTFALEINTSSVNGSGVVASSLDNITGGFTLGPVAPTLSVTDLGANIALALGDTIDLISYTGPWDNNLFQIAGFGPIPNGGSFPSGNNIYQINYASGVPGSENVVLTVVPEPSGAASLLGGVGMLIGLRRFRRRSIT